jgi:hypothetical protein
VEQSKAQVIDAAPAKRGNRMLWAVIAVCAAPMLISYLTYYVIKPQSRSNYGALLDPRSHPIPALAGRDLGGKPVELDAWRGKWILLQADSGDCGEYCQKKLWEMRQLRLITGKEMGRVERVWLVTDDKTPQATLQSEFEGTHVLRVNAETLRRWLPTESNTLAADHIYIVDPLGNLMMRFPKEGDPNRMKRDIGRLLKASAIG